MKRSAEEERVLADFLSRQAVRDREAWPHLVRPLVPGPILEVGCGTGLLLDYLASECPGPVVGLDLSLSLLEEARRRAAGRGNVVLVCGSGTEPPFPSGSFANIVLNKAWHEIWAGQGRDGALLALGRYRGLLRDGGRLVIRDNSRPEGRPARLGFKSDRLEALFGRFVREFQPRRIPWSQAGPRAVTLDIGDALEFITKTSEENWSAEMREPHFTLLDQEWEPVLSRAGFSDVSVERDPSWRPPPLEEVEIDFLIPPYKVIAVAAKAGGGP